MLRQFFLALVLTTSLSDVAPAQMMPGLNGVMLMSSPRSLPTVTYDASAQSSCVAAVCTATGISIGAADTSRVVAVCATGTAAGAATISSATIGGIAATVQIQTSASGARGVTGLLTAAVPTGTTATVAVTYSTSMTRAAFGTYSLLNLNSATATATNSAATTTSSQAQSPLGVNISANGVVVGCSYDNGDAGNPAPITWVGSATGTACVSNTCDYNLNSNSDGNTGIHYTATAAESPHAMSATWTTSSRGDGVTAAFR